MKDRTLSKYYRDKIEHIVLNVTKNIYQRMPQNAVQAADRRTVFVAGVQRSGTNMIMDVVGRSYETDVYHESDRRAFDNYEMRDIPIIRNLFNKSHAPVFIIKSLCELQSLKVLMDEFSPARTVWVVRNYDDVVSSMLVSFSNQAQQVLRISQDRNSNGWRGRGMSDETHALIKELVRQDINDASAAALSWYFRNILFFEQGFEENPDVMLVKYEDLVTGPDRQFNNVFSFMGVKYTPWVSCKVFANSVRRREPKNIDPEIRNICNELTERMNKVINKSA